MLVRVLGDFAVHRNGVRVALGGPKPRSLLAVLVAARGQVVSIERLVDQLWGDAPPPKVVGAIQVYVANLRRQLEPAREAGGQPGFLVTRPSGYALRLPDDAVDAERFQRLLDSAAIASEAREAERFLVDALDLWQGPPYAGLDMVPLLAVEASRLQELRVLAQERLWAVRLDRGAEEQAAVALAALAAEHPERERLWALLMIALYRSGRQVEALDAARRIRAHLLDELGISPGPELRQLEQAVLRHDQSLLASPVAPIGHARRGNSPSSPVAQPRGPATAGPQEGLAGRADALATTRRLVADVAAGSGRVLLITGEPGIGKTRLTEAIAVTASAAGLRPLRGGWEPEGCPPLWGWTRALGASAQIVRDSPDDRGDDTASVTYRLADDVRARLSEGGGSCLVLDDVHWADADSLRLIGQVASTIENAPVLLVIACRQPMPETSPALQGMLAALARLGAERLALSGLRGAEISDLVNGTTGLQIEPTVAARLEERTGGNPFYVRELVHLLASEGGLGDISHDAWHQVPHGVRDTVRHRTADLPGPAREALALAAVFGRRVDLDLLELAWEADPATLSPALEAALAAGLVTEEPSGQLQFSHALVRDAVYGLVGPLTRRQLHARAAQTIERCRSGHLDQHAASLAEHYRLAGPFHVRSAWMFFARAASVSAHTGAHEDAAGQLAAAAGLQADDTLATPQEREELHVAWGTALRRSGRIAEVWTPVRIAAESALERGDPAAAARSLLVVTENVLWSWRTGYTTDEPAVELWQRVVAGLPGTETGLRARCVAALSAEVVHDPPGGRCAPWADEALHLARQSGDNAVRVDVLHVVLNSLRRPDLLPRRVPAADELVMLCAKGGDERSLAVALCKRALNYSAYGRPEAAVEDLRRSLELAQRHRMAPALMVIHLAMAIHHQARGDWSAFEAAVRAAEVVQSTLSMAGTGVTLLLRASALLPQGRIGEAEPALRGASAVHPALRDLHALAVLNTAGADEARTLLGPWREQPQLTWDYLWVSSATLRAVLWAGLGDPEAVAELRRHLEPYADRVADGAMAALFMGSVRHTLAVLALAGGDHPAARRWATEARDVHARLGWTPWARLSQELLDRIPTSAA